MEEYQSQYKKTYFQDEENLRRLARMRLSLLEAQIASARINSSHLPVMQPRLLEIGSATGFFLDEARKFGYQVQGIEISEDGTRYSREVLGLDVWQGSFLDYPQQGADGKNQFQVIASFFTLEHINGLETLWMKIDSLLDRGGFLILALPSFYGPTFQTNPREWFKTHPTDHFYDYDPRSLKNVLKQLGYELKVKIPLSYHPKRDKGWKGFLPQFGYRWFSDRNCYGDTFQIIALKK